MRSQNQLIEYASQHLELGFASSEIVEQLVANGVDPYSAKRIVDRAERKLLEKPITNPKPRILVITVTIMLVLLVIGLVTSRNFGPPQPPPLQLPTVVAEVVATNTATETATPLPQVTLNADDIDVREGPSKNYEPVLTKVHKNDTLTVLGRSGGQRWIKVRSADGHEGWMDADSQYITLNSDFDSLPVAYFRPPSGIVQGITLLNGKGTLTAKNNSSNDGEVIVARGNEPLVVAYVRAGEIYVVNAIPDGEYILSVFLGSEWDGIQFHRAEDYMLFEDAFLYTTTVQESYIYYKTVTISLAPVVDPKNPARTIHLPPTVIPITPDP